MIGSIFVPAYWPFFKTHELRRFDYTAPSAPNFTSVFSYDTGSDSMLYNNYDANLTWLNKWYYQYRAGFGVAEWRDDYPNNKKVVLNPPIGWGEFVDIGDNYQNKPQFDFFKCWPPATSSGTQIVQFEDRIASMGVNGVYYNDVIVFSYLQAWNGKPATGARYWMAMGIGPVATQFLTQSATDPKKVTESVRWDARVTRVNA
jgi:hypothetical protein